MKSFTLILLFATILASAIDAYEIFERKAIIGKKAKLRGNAYACNGATIGTGAQIGTDSRVYAGATIPDRFKISNAYVIEYPTTTTLIDMMNLLFKGKQANKE